jgi:protein-tyrosine phosphatase
MKPFWVDTGDQLRLAIVPRPRGNDWLEDELRFMRQSDIDVLVSMLTAEEVVELGLSDEATACTQARIDFRSFPIRDREVPKSYAAIQSFVDDLRRELHVGKSVAVHCRASIGRASLLLACILCTEGWSAQEAFTKISEARRLRVPDTQDQVRWVEGFSASIVRGT